MTTTPRKRALSDAELIEVWQQVRKTMDAVDGRVACALASSDAPAALVYEALAALAAAPDRMLRLSTLAQVLGVSTGETAVLVDRLVGAGLMARSHAGRDRREVYAVLTSTGIDYERTGTPAYAQQLRVEFSVIGPRRVSQLREILDLLRGWRPSSHGHDAWSHPTEVAPGAALPSSSERDLMGAPARPR